MYNIHAGSISINIFPSTLFQLAIHGLKFPIEQSANYFFLLTD